MANLKTFADLEFATHPSDAMGGQQARMMFENGYGCSVIRGPFTYGGPEGMFELAVLDENGLCYDTPVTDDVLGWLSPADVTEKMAEIQALAKKEDA